MHFTPARREALLKVAFAAIMLADDIDPAKFQVIGNVSDLADAAESLRTRKLAPWDARHLTLALRQLTPGLNLDRVPALVQEYAIRQLGPTEMLGPLRDIIHTLDSLSLGEYPMFEDMEQNQAVAQLRKAGERLKSALMFDPSDVQRDILAALRERAMTSDELQRELNIGRNTLFGRKDRNGGDKGGGLNELTALGFVLNDRKRGGYFLPDSSTTREWD